MEDIAEDEVMEDTDAVQNSVQSDDMEIQDAGEAAVLPPSFKPAPPNFVSTSGTTRQYGKMTSEDVFCNVLQRLAIASNSQINKLMKDIRPVSRSAAETVAATLLQKDWLAPMSANAELFHAQMGEMLTTPALTPGLTQKDINAVRTNRLAHFATGMAEYRTILFVQQEGLEMLLKHVSVWPAAPTSTAASLRAQKQKDKSLFLFREHEKKMLGIIINSMRWHSKILILQRVGCRLLERFVMRIMTGDKTAKNTLIVSNVVLKRVIDTILFALESFPCDEELAQVACRALAASCYSSHFERGAYPEIQSYVSHRNMLYGTELEVVLLPKMLELMRTFESNEILVEAVCNVAYFFGLMANPGLGYASETVFCAMNAHISNDHIQMYGCLSMSLFMRHEVLDDATASKYIHFLVNSIQMSHNRYLIRAAEMACVTLLEKADQASLVMRQDLCGEAGLIRLLLSWLHSLCPRLFNVMRGDRAMQKHMMLVENDMLVCLSLLSLISTNHAMNNKRLLEADAPQTLMYVQTAFATKIYAGRNVIWQNRESVDFFVWMMFSGLSLQPTPELQTGALRLFCTEFSCQLHAEDRDNVVPNTLHPYKELHHTPVHFCCETLMLSGNIKALTATLDFLYLCARTPAIRETMGDELTKAMVIAISRSDAFADRHHFHRHYVRCISTKILEFISRTKMLRTKQGLNNIIFKAVSPALATNVEYMKQLQALQKRLLNMQGHYVSHTACNSLLASKLLTAEDTNTVLLLQKTIGVNVEPSIGTVCKFLCLIYLFFVFWSMHDGLPNRVPWYYCAGIQGRRAPVQKVQPRPTGECFSVTVPIDKISSHIHVFQ